MPAASITDFDTLLAAVRAGLRPEYLFFWGHRRSSGKGVGKECLSQWWPAAFEVDGQRYASAEHFMMAEKARLFGDEETRARIVEADGPDAAKKLGRRVRGFEESVLERERFAIVVAGNRAKFEQHPSLGAFLLGTAERVLVEASPLDRIWGIGLGAEDPAARDPERWRGLNLLGFALMQVRDGLR